MENILKDRYHICELKDPNAKIELAVETDSWELILGKERTQIKSCPYCGYSLYTKNEKLLAKLLYNSISSFLSRNIFSKSEGSKGQLLEEWKSRKFTFKDGKTYFRVANYDELYEITNMVMTQIEQIFESEYNKHYKIVYTDINNISEYYELPKRIKESINRSIKLVCSEYLKKNKEFLDNKNELIKFWKEYVLKEPKFYYWASQIQEPVPWESYIAEKLIREIRKDMINWGKNSIENRRNDG